MLLLHSRIRETSARDANTSVQSLTMCVRKGCQETLVLLILDEDIVHQSVDGRPIDRDCFPSRVFVCNGWFWRCSFASPPELDIFPLPLRLGWIFVSFASPPVQRDFFLLFSSFLSLFWGQFFLGQSGFWKGVPISSFFGNSARK